MTEVTLKKIEKVKNLVSQGYALKDAAKRVNIGLGHYYRSRKKLNARNTILVNPTLYPSKFLAPQTIKVSFMGMEISGDPNIVKDFMMKFMKEYRQP